MVEILVWGIVRVLGFFFIGALNGCFFFEIGGLVFVEGDVKGFCSEGFYIWE